MVLKLYGSAMSTSRVLVAILEKELPYELILVDVAKGDQKTEDYKKLQPFGKVPVLDDDGFIMFESRAICKYLARCDRFCLHSNRVYVIINLTLKKKIPLR